jgi:predicted transcriptional regulator
VTSVDDLRLRVLGALVPGTPENLDVLAGKVAVTTDTLIRRLGPLVAAGLVQRRSKKTVVITEAGSRALAEQTPPHRRLVPRHRAATPAGAVAELCPCP